MTRPDPGTVETLKPGLRRIVADNASPMTHWGTNTYMLGLGELAVIDPGPDDPKHMQAILSALKPGEAISHILITHAHLDHSPLARSLAQTTGAPIYAYGDAQSGRSDIMRTLAASGLARGGEGVDAMFRPDVTLKDGHVLHGDRWTIKAIWTPGHFGNHMCFQWDDTVFTGDHVMGWASSLVSPPDGDLTDFMTSSQILAALNAKTYYPGHGAPVTNPATRINWLINHRKSRESDILSALGNTATDITTLTKSIYVDTPVMLLGAAERNVFAHLVDLVQSGRVSVVGPLSPEAGYLLK